MAADYSDSMPDSKYTRDRGYHPLEEVKERPKKKDLLLTDVETARTVVEVCNLVQLSSTCISYASNYLMFHSDRCGLWYRSPQINPSILVKTCTNSSKRVTINEMWKPHCSSNNHQTNYSPSPNVEAQDVATTLSSTIQSPQRKSNRLVDKAKCRVGKGAIQVAQELLVKKLGAIPLSRKLQVRTCLNNLIFT